MSRFSLTFACAVCCGLHVYGKMSGEAIAVNAVRIAFEFYSEHHRDHYPTNWTQVKEITNLEKINRVLGIDSISFPVERHYVFVPEALNLKDPRSRRILLIRDAPVYQPGQPRPNGRYAIALECKDPLGRILTNCVPVLRWIEENEVQEMLRKASGLLPNQDFKAANDAEAAVKQKLRQREEWHRIALFTSYKLRAIEILQSIKNWVVLSPRTNLSNVASAKAQVERLRPSAVMIATLVLLGGTVAVGILFKVRGKKD